MKNPKILVVDDECDDLACMEGILKNHKYAVTSVTSGEEALEKLKKNTYELILIDILMPHISGYELLKIIRKKFDHHAKLIYVSIVPKKEVDLKGADGFIQKPFTPESFIEQVKKILK